jgi:hypothetical protein
MPEDRCGGSLAGSESVNVASTERTGDGGLGTVCRSRHRIRPLPFTW